MFFDQSVESRPHVVVRPDNEQTGVWNAPGGFDKCRDQKLQPFAFSQTSEEKNDGASAQPPLPAEAIPRGQSGERIGKYPIGDDADLSALKRNTMVCP